MANMACWPKLSLIIVPTKKKSLPTSEDFPTMFDYQRVIPNFEGSLRIQVYENHLAGTGGLYPS